MKTLPMLLSLLALPLLTLPAATQAPTDPDTAYVPGEYRVYTGSGDAATLEDIERAMTDVQVVFVGETHDDPTGHMLELELLRRADAARARRPLALSLEFFARDAQLPLDEYLAGLITESAFLADASPWPRYDTDYRPLVEYAKERGVSVVAANAPRRYVNMVTRGGREALDRLSPEAFEYLPPLPYGSASSSYRDQWIGTMSAVMEQEGMRCGVPVPHAAAPAGSHANMGRLLDSQVLWDAAMAHSIARHLAEQPNALIVHMVGGFHVERGTGTPEQLERYAPGTSRLIVSLRPVDDVGAFRPAPEGEWGDFVIQTDRSRTLQEIECRTSRAEHGIG